MSEEGEETRLPIKQIIYFAIGITFFLLVWFMFTTYNSKILGP